MLKKALCSWSGGKDSCYALLQSAQMGYTPGVLLNVLNEEGKISRSHGIPANILEAQAVKAKLPVYLISSSWESYEVNFTSALITLRDRYDVSYAIFGDIDLQAHRDWEEMVAKKANLTAVLPLWKQDRRSLVLQMIESGIRAMIVSCNETMGESFLGRMITKELVTELEAMGIDACGENGEYHTLVLDCPFFESAIDVRVIGKISHGGYWFSTLELVK